MGLTLLSQTDVSLHYWDHAFLIGVYLINRLPYSYIRNKFPFHKLFHKTSNYSFSKFLDVLASHSSDPIILINFNTGHKSVFLGYKCLASDDEICISKDVLFNESKFPYPILFSSKPYTSTDSHPNPSLSLFYLISLLLLVHNPPHYSLPFYINIILIIDNKC